MSKVIVNGLKLNTAFLPQRGSGGTPIVFVHGLAASSVFWYLAGAQVMSRMGPCLLYDLRGHGKSDVPESGFTISSMAGDLLALLDHFDIPQAHLVAHSFGGMISLYAALQAPERFKSLVLADVRVRPLQDKLELKARSIPPRLVERLQAIGVTIDQSKADQDGVDYLKTVAHIQLAAGDEANDLLREIYQHPRLFRSRRNAEKWIALTERASFLNDIKDGAGFSPEDLSRLKMPMLILVGSKSPTMPSAHALSRLCEHSVLVELPNVGHFFPTSQPRFFLRPTTRFLRAVNAGRTEFPKQFDVAAMRRGRH